MPPPRSRTPRPRIRRAIRPVAAAAVLPALVLTFAACGGDSNAASSASPSAGAYGQRPAGGRRFAQDPKVQACLKKEGVTLPMGRPGGPRRGPGPGAGGMPPAGSGERPPAGTTPQRPRRDPAQFAKLQAALKKCGVDFRGGRPGGRPPTGGTATQPAPSTTAS